MDENFLAAMGELVENHVTDDGVDLIGLAAVFIQFYKEMAKPSHEDWENMQTSVKNAGLIFDNLIEQEKNELRKEQDG